jgi:hypothetical protein
MDMEDLLPPYTLAERSRELCMSSRALCCRAQRAHTRSRQLRDKSAALRLKVYRQRRATRTTLQRSEKHCSPSFASLPLSASLSLFLYLPNQVVQQCQGSSPLPA